MTVVATTFPIQERGEGDEEVESEDMDASSGSCAWLKILVVVGGIVDWVFAREDGTNPDTVQLWRTMNAATQQVVVMEVARVFIVAMKMEKVWFPAVNVTFKNRELRRTWCMNNTVNIQNAQR